MSMHRNSSDYPAETSARRRFWWLWLLLLTAKLMLAWRLPLFGDEAFYWLEGQQLAWAYSDLPGMTAWLAALGVGIGGHSELALRLPFLVVSAISAFWVVRIARRFSSQTLAWNAGCWAMLLPLFGTLGVLALPDVPLTLATLLCVDAMLGLRRRPGSRADAVWLALGLMLGAFSHYRFGVVLAVGAVALLLDPHSRRMLRRPLPWLAAVLGALAWLPLILFNLQHGEAGWRFQLVDRHPWAFHSDAVSQLPIQMLLVTPLLFGLLLATLFWLWRRRREADQPWRLLALCSGLLLIGLLLLGFFTDRQRVSFHWPLPAWLLLCTALPVYLAMLRACWLAAAAATLAGLGLVFLLLLLALTTSASGRQTMDRWGIYPDNFAGWREAAAMVRDLPELTSGEAELVADHFKLGAELAFALNNPHLPMLDHALNHKHGRAAQLQIWGLQTRLDQATARRRLVLVEDDAIPQRDREAYYAALCAQAGGLRLRQDLSVDGGAKRFVLFEQVDAAEGCALPATGSNRAEPLSTN